MKAALQAANRIRALVSGLPTVEARSRLFVMLQAYVDGSGSGDPEALILAGYIADSETWAAFSQEWKEQLDHAGLARFKMNEMVNRPEVAAYFYRLIEKHNVLAAISVIVDTAGLIKLVREIVPDSIQGRDHLENPYYMAFKAIIETVARYQNRMGMNEPIDFIFDDESSKDQIHAMWDWMKTLANPEIRSMIGDEPIFRADEKFMPLQAADLYAWWVRKWHRDHNDDGIKNLEFAWQAKRMINRLHIGYPEAALRKIIEDGMKKQPHVTRFIGAMNNNPKRAQKYLDRAQNGVRMTLPDPTSAIWKR